MKPIIRLFLMTILSYETSCAQTVHLTKTIKTQVITNISRSLRDNYIYLDTAVRMTRYIEHQLKAGAYDSIQSPPVFAYRLTSDLLSVYHDGHLSINYDPGFASASGSPDTNAQKARMLKFRKRVNFGFDRAEILQGNIGYLQIGGFFEPDNEAKAMAEAALRFVSNSDALIIDLRNNKGGDPHMVSYICSYFFNTRTHLNDLYVRKDKSTTEYWAIPNNLLKSLQAIPLYILTSQKTFSAGEELTYDLRTQKRAIIIGEVTGGGAHPVQPIDAGNGFVSNIPFARAINAITKTDWETTGVKPDILIPAEKALDEALKTIKLR